MNIVELFKKIFVPSYTDRPVKTISADNQRQMKAVTKDLKSSNKLLSDPDVARMFFIATGGKHGH